LSRRIGLLCRVGLEVSETAQLRNDCWLDCFVVDIKMDNDNSYFQYSDVLWKNSQVGLDFYHVFFNDLNTQNIQEIARFLGAFFSRHS
jgi:hypothetical protein